MWPSLETIDLSDSGFALLDANGQRPCKWPRVKHIDLSQNTVAGGLPVLMKMQWPLLECLDLSNNDLNASMIQLIETCWPGLKTLDQKRLGSDSMQLK